MKPCLWLMAVILVVGCGGMEGPPGPAGPQGPKGDPGVQGPRGAPGTNGSGLTEAWECSGTATFPWTGGKADLAHAVWKFADGSVLTSCEAWSGQYAVQGTNMWRSGGDATIATCFVGADAEENRTGGFWEFASLGSTVSQATYHDAGSTLNGRTFVMSNCKVR